MEKKYVLQPLSKEELETINAKLQAFEQENGIVMQMVPKFVPNMVDDKPTGKFVIDVNLLINKKVEVPQEDGEETPKAD